MRPNVLLVDGSAVMRNSVAERLRVAGYVVRDASDPSEAVDLLRESAIDVVVIDPQLPRGDGLELLRSIRKDEHLKLLPIVIYTTSENPDFMKRIRTLRTSTLLHKSQSSFDDLTGAIERLVTYSVSAEEDAALKQPTSAPAAVAVRSRRHLK